ncbi:MAG: metal ABC transporter permease [Eubacteriales bacterium]
MTMLENFLQQLQFYLGYDFVRNALVVGILISLCSSLLGVTLVLKRFSLISDGLSHVAFGVMSFAVVINLTNDILVVMPATIACAAFLLNAGENAGLKGDAAIAMMSVSALAIGYLIVNIFSASANVSGDVCSTLFGSTSILTLTKFEVIICIAMSIVVVLVFIIFYNKIFAVTFDETFASATGLKVKRYNFMIAIITAVIIVLAMNLVGSLLVSALIVFPALSAMRIFKSFKCVVICSSILSVLCSIFGMLLSIMKGTPVGASIVVIDMIVFLGFCVVSKILKGRAIS